MKVIVSHDVDHITFAEHFTRDMYIPKWLAKNIGYGLMRQIPLGLACRRMAAIATQKLNHVAEVMETDRRCGIPSTFFVGMANGLSMSYSLAAAAEMVKLVQDGGFAAGVHGIAYTDEAAIRAERDRFREISSREALFGVRNHYLRLRGETLGLQARAGYAFDSSEYGQRNPYVVDQMVEFPVCLMDAYLLSLGRNDIEDVKRRTLDALQHGRELGLSHFTIIFHDCYYSALFPDHQAWYDWLVRHLSDNYDVTDFASALGEIKAKHIRA